MMSVPASPVRFLCTNRPLARPALAPFNKKNLRSHCGTPWCRPGSSSGSTHLDRSSQSKGRTNNG
jgi:hypothetical protein